MIRKGGFLITFNPKSYDELIIENISYNIAEHPSAPGMAYGQEGRRAVVYQLVDQSGNKHALKVFKQRFRVPRLTTVAEKLKPYAVLPGLQASERIVLTSSQHRSLLKKYPELTYAVLMPWVEGPTWVEVLLSDVSITRDQSLQIANSFIETLVMMEERGLAHCDLSGPNTIITTGNRVALVDLEEMYGPDFLKPRVVPAGSPGYAHKSAPEGLWREESDRFAGAVLVAEMLGWVNDSVRANARGESYFDAGELQKGNGRFDVLARALGETWGEGVTKLLERVWQSERLVDCPTFAEWSLVLPEAGKREPISPIVDAVEVGKIDIVEEDIASDLGDVWYCSYCEQPVAVKLGVCPHCELGRRPEDLVPSAEKETWRCPHCQKTITGEEEVCPYCKKGIDEPVEVLITKQKKRIPLWGWVGIGIVIVGLSLRLVVVSSGDKISSSSAQKTPTSIITHQPTKTTLSIKTEARLPTSNIVPTLGVGSTQISSTDGMVMVYVPEGSFDMGSEYGQDDEDPVHSVYLDAFWIDQTEVTNAMFAEFLNEMGNQTKGKGTWLDTEDIENDERIVWKGNEWKPISGYGNHPVTEVTWYGAQAYCEWAGRRLPTEAEWEKAARGTDGRTYPWGNGFNGNLVNYCDIKCIKDGADDEYTDGYAQTAPVGRYPGGASPYGVLDMAGNVYEWVSDWYGEDYYYNSPNSNPYGPSHGTFKVNRGGAWWSISKYVRVANRGYASRYDSDDNYGFRCVLSP